MSKVTQYLAEGLAGIGVTVLDMTVALKLRPDLWHAAGSCNTDWCEAIPRIEHVLSRLGATTYVAAFADGGRVKVAARSLHMLAERITWITGREVKSIVPHVPAPAEEMAPPSLPPHLRERDEKLRRLAAQDPPTHCCPLRTEILAAREELARRERT